MSSPVCFSKSNRNLILTVDLVVALADTLRADRAMPVKTRRCVDRIKARILNIQNIVYGGSTLVLDPAEYRQYSRIVLSIKKLINNISNNNVVELDFFNAVLVLVEDARISSRRSKNKRLPREWDYLNQSLSTLYSHIDPDLSQYKWMALGENLATRFKRIMIG